MEANTNKKARKELRAKRSLLIREMRFTHDRLLLGENPLKNITSVLNALIALHEIREKLREKEHQHK